MADRPVTTNLPADLPENWQANQIVSPNGTEVGLDEKHGFNYLGKMLNKVHTAVNAINAAFDDLAPLIHSHTKSQITDFAHKSTHATGGTDPIAPGDIGAYTKYETDMKFQYSSARQYKSTFELMMTGRFTRA